MKRRHWISHSLITIFNIVFTQIVNGNGTNVVNGDGTVVNVQGKV